MNMLHQGISMIVSLNEYHGKSIEQIRSLRFLEDILWFCHSKSILWGIGFVFWYGSKQELISVMAIFGRSPNIPKKKMIGSD